MRLPWSSRVTGNQGSIPEREPEKRLPHPRKTVGTQVTHSRPREIVTKNNDTGLFRDPVIGMIVSLGRVSAPSGLAGSGRFPNRDRNLSWRGVRSVYLEETEVLKAGLSPAQGCME
ncbi:hypothetical protein NPIL_388751 [Nephila pilipes]|uniref:Uncharacterized protein n=1 Tax=Nephila pilipes TaxID=299642 RepID=A0A8X6MPQ4_NEPPI|nr:hypothetical protein NPIL_388751 [Nephila pilipes]